MKKSRALLKEAGYARAPKRTPLRTKFVRKHFQLMAPYGRECASVFLIGSGRSPGWFHRDGSKGAEWQVRQFRLQIASFLSSPAFPLSTRLTKGCSDGEPKNDYHNGNRSHA